MDCLDSICMFPRHFFRGSWFHVSFFAAQKAFCPLRFLLANPGPRPVLARPEKHASFGQQWPKFWLSDWKLLLSILIHCWVWFSEYKPTTYLLRAQWGHWEAWPKVVESVFIHLKSCKSMSSWRKHGLRLVCCSTALFKLVQSESKGTLSWSLFPVFCMFFCSHAFGRHLYVHIHMSSYVIILSISQLGMIWQKLGWLCHHTQFLFVARPVMWCQRTLHAMGLWPSPTQRIVTRSSTGGHGGRPTGEKTDTPRYPKARQKIWQSKGNPNESSHHWCRKFNSIRGIVRNGIYHRIR